MWTFGAALLFIGIRPRLLIWTFGIFEAVMLKQGLRIPKQRFAPRGVNQIRPLQGRPWLAVLG